MRRGFANCPRRRAPEQLVLLVFLFILIRHTALRCLDPHREFRIDDQSRQ
jgi:hypothetical protein